MPNLNKINPKIKMNAKNSEFSVDQIQTILDTIVSKTSLKEEEELTKKAKTFFDIIEARTREVREELAELEEEYERIKQLEADPDQMVEHLRHLNREEGSGAVPEEIKDFDKIGRIKTRIVIDAEQSLNERAF
jgi:iron-sulfur cluster repair protein YtfE (RIC family)